jgi:hypothetical protein
VAKKRGKFVRHLPFLIAVSGMGAAIWSARTYQQELDRVLDNTENMIEIEPGKMQKVREEGAILTVRYQNGTLVYELAYPGISESK